MNGKDLFLGLSYISRKYIEEAEQEMLPDKKQPRKVIHFRRPLLVAAILALALLLVGCAVVYALRLQDMSIGKETYVQSFDDKGKAIEPVEKTRDIVTLYGHSGDAIQQAMAEWYAFLETYDPDGALMDNDPDHDEIPNSYEYTYSCYTQEMVDKVDEIAGKYNLKLLDEWIPFQAWQSDIFFEETGIGSFLLDDSGAKIDHVAGMYFPPYNFSMDFELAADQLDTKVWCSMEYARKDYFPREFPGGLDLSLFEQWDHTAPDGTPLLLALNNKGTGYIIAEPGDAMQILYLDGNFSGSAYPEPDEILTKAEVEMIADLFDYSIQPQVADRSVIEQRLVGTEEVHAAEYSYVPETYSSFVDYITMTYTIPYEDLQYTFHDLTGDGDEELLIGRNGSYSYWVTLRDGETQEQMVLDTYLCENGIQEWYSAHEIYETHSYVLPVSESVISDIGTEQTVLNVLKRVQDQWSMGPNDYEQTPITEAEAKAIMDQYPRIALNWTPLLDYPVSESQTFRGYLEEKDIRVSNEELRDIYKEYLANMRSMHYSHYRILDINGDGVEDLLLKGEDDSLIGNTDFYWMAMTYRYGRIVNFASDFYLCENNVLEHVSTRNREGVEMQGHEYVRYEGLKRESMDFTVYNKAMDAWQSDFYDTTMSTSEAEAILSKYPRIDQGMRPISELMD